MSGLLGRPVISSEAFMLSLGDFLASGDAEPKMFYAGGLAHLSCGHVRPVNTRWERGDEIPCTVCGNAAVLELELFDEPVEFPRVDSIFGDVA